MSGRIASLVFELATLIEGGGRAYVVGHRMIVGPPIIFEVDDDGRYIRVGEMVPEQAGVRVVLPNGQVLLIATSTIQEAGEMLAEAELLLMRA